MDLYNQLICYQVLNRYEHNQVHEEFIFFLSEHN
jgi:hypothetical protein